MGAIVIEIERVKRGRQKVDWIEIENVECWGLVDTE
jgi:hypothetical protein